ncbi:MAG: hypothetical protein JWQ49_4309 [Edaphobacter sp.]|nr:hypothetical protein [Edaphobacter sp.]
MGQLRSITLIYHKLTAYPETRNPPTLAIVRKTTGDIFYESLDSPMVLFEFRDYGTEAVGKEATNQMRNYFSEPMETSLRMLAEIASQRGAYKTQHGL